MILFGGSFFNLISVYLGLVILCMILYPDSIYMSPLMALLAIFEFIKIFFQAIFNSITQFSAEEVESVVVITEQVSQVIAQSLTMKDIIVNLLSLFVGISLSISLTNLLPLLRLDGGHIVTLIIEKILKRPLKDHTKMIAAICCMLPLFILMICLIG